MQNILNDLKFALRQLRRSPGFALTAVLTLALGIGANTAIFSLLNQALLRSLPVRDPESLAVFRNSSPVWNGSISMNGGDPEDAFSYPQYLALRDGGRGLAGVLATTTAQTTLVRNNNAQQISNEIVSGNYFQVLGVAPSLGRLLQPSDDTAPGANPVAVLSYDFWQSKLGADPSVVGSTVTLSGRPFQVVGVAAPRFTSAVWGQKTGVFVPMSELQQVLPQAGNRYNDHSYKWLNMLGRLQPGVTPAEAQRENALLWHNLLLSDLATNGGGSARFRTEFLSSQLLISPGARGFNFNRSGLEKPFLAIMAMAALVLLIASVNVASLLMVRSAGRIREFSLRAALGASSARVVVQLLLEGVLLGIGGGVVGVMLAPLALRALISRLADTSGQTPFSAAPDIPVLLFNFGVAIAVSLAFSLVPALQLRKPNLTSTLRESTGTVAGGLALLRRVVVCLQIGLSVVLLVGAGLFLRTMQQLRAVNLGFNATHLLTFSIDPLLAGYRSAEVPVVQQRVLEGLATVPGVLTVAGSDTLALSGNTSMYGISLSNYTAPPDNSYQVQNVSATPNYLSALQVPMIAGRALSETDTLDHPNVAVVDQTFVQHFCNGSNESCLGRRIGIGTSVDGKKIEMAIVGVFQNFRNRSIRDDNPASMIRPLKQNPDASRLFLALRTSLPPADAANEVRVAMRRIDPKLPPDTMVTMDQQIDSDLSNERIIALLAMSFGALATVLAGVGLYGVLAYSTAQRTREIGIRMALGSSRWSVARLVLANVLGLAAVGIAVAIPVAIGLSMLVRSQLFGVSSTDPVVLLGVVVLIGLVALLAAVIPARRAAGISPVVALRAE